MDGAGEKDKRTRRRRKRSKKNARRERGKICLKMLPGERRIELCSYFWGNRKNYADGASGEKETVWGVRRRAEAGCTSVESKGLKGKD